MAQHCVRVQTGTGQYAGGSLAIGVDDGTGVSWLDTVSPLNGRMDRSFMRLATVSSRAFNFVG